jgi:hypothetical protein
VRKICVKAYKKQKTARHQLDKEILKMSFRDSPLWIKVAFLTMSIGFLLDLFGFAIGMGDNNTVTMALLVAGFLCFLIAAILALVITFIDEVRASKLAKICLIVFALAAGVLTIVAIGLWGARDTNSNNPIGCYSSLVGVSGSALAILTALFIVLDLSGCWSGRK